MILITRVTPTHQFAYQYVMVQKKKTHASMSLPSAALTQITGGV